MLPKQTNKQTKKPERQRKTRNKKIKKKRKWPISPDWHRAVPGTVIGNQRVFSLALFSLSLGGQARLCLYARQIPALPVLTTTTFPKLRSLRELQLAVEEGNEPRIEQSGTEGHSPVSTFLPSPFMET
jgi:hypothetical protein